MTARNAFAIVSRGSSLNGFRCGAARRHIRFVWQRVMVADQLPIRFWRSVNSTRTSRNRSCCYSVLSPLVEHESDNPITRRFFINHYANVFWNVESSPLCPYGRLAFEIFANAEQRIIWKFHFLETFQRHTGNSDCNDHHLHNTVRIETMKWKQ